MSTLFALMPACSADPGGGSQTCQVYLNCLAATDVSSFEEQSGLYGKSGSCFTQNDRTTCDSACGEKLAVVAAQNPNEEACELPEQTAEDTDGSTSSTSGGSTTGGSSGSGTTGDPTGSEAEEGLDVLFVVDNSGSMGEEQTTLVSGIAEFVAVLDGANIDYRIGVTTTDNGNPWCDGTTPEAGALVLSSCRERLDDFVFQGQTTTDATQACLDACPEEVSAALASGTAPTTTVEDQIPRRRPWIENIGDATNLPEGVSVTEALGCLLPQGINGCGFEAHLESFYKAIRRSGMPGEDQYGFLRPDTALLIVLLTDEADCSANEDHDSIFLPDGNKTFWSLPEEAAPNSAVCWNAGTRCTVDGSGLDCDPADLDVLGQSVSPSNAEDQAVLRPLSRYVEALSDLGRTVTVAAVSGVPLDYPAEPIVYKDAPEGTPNDPDFQINFGIGPGCVSTVAEAVPPVRIRALAEVFSQGEPPLSSVCDTDYGPALAALAQRVTSG